MGDIFDGRIDSWELSILDPRNQTRSDPAVQIARRQRTDLYEFMHYEWLELWSELLGAAALLLGLGTRFFSASLMVLTAVAWAAVHAGNGYNVCGNGFKLPLIYLVLFLPLLLSGPGKFSLDYRLARRRGGCD